MIIYEVGCEIAYNYYKENGKEGLCEANDLGKKWLFAGGDPEEVEVGGYSITVDKETGKIEPFILPDMKNFELLDKAIPLDIPSEYVFKK